MAVAFRGWLLLLVECAFTEAAMLRGSLDLRTLRRPVERDSESHIPPFRADGSLEFFSGAPEGTSRGSIDIEVPRDFSKFMEGLMWRRQLNDHQGMIFQWNEDGPRGFWRRQLNDHQGMIFQ